MCSECNQSAWQTGFMLHTSADSDYTLQQNDLRSESDSNVLASKMYSQVFKVKVLAVVSESYCRGVVWPCKVLAAVSFQQWLKPMMFAQIGFRNNRSFLLVPLEVLHLQFDHRNWGPNVFQSRGCYSLESPSKHRPRGAEVPNGPGPIGLQFAVVAVWNLQFDFWSIKKIKTLTQASEGRQVTVRQIKGFLVV